MRRFVVIIAIASAALLIVAQPRPPAMGNRTVVVELFTSQG